MMTALHALSYAAGTAAFLFVLLSLASGLLYIAEVIEEHSGLAKVVGQRTIYLIILILVALHVFDGLPLYLTALGIVSHIVYLQNFSRTWPSISLTSIWFMLSCILVVASHFVSFRYFSERSRASGYAYNSYNNNRANGRWNAHGSHLNTHDSFVDVATYFGVCVWLCPFFLFLSLSANDNVLPSAGEVNAPATPTASHRVPGSPGHSRKQSSMLKNALSSAFRIVPTTLRPSALSAITNSRGGPQRDGLLVSSQPSSPTVYSSGGGGAAARTWGTGDGSGSPSPTLAFGFQSNGAAGSDYSRRTSTVSNYSRRESSAGGPPSPVDAPSRLRQTAPSLSRRHTTEEGLGLGVGAGLQTMSSMSASSSSSPTGLGPSLSSGLRTPSGLGPTRRESMRDSPSQESALAGQQAQAMRQMAAAAAAAGGHGGPPGSPIRASPIRGPHPPLQPQPQPQALPSLNLNLNSMNGGPAAGTSGVAPQAGVAGSSPTVVKRRVA